MQKNYQIQQQIRGGTQNVKKVVDNIDFEESK
jgi:hypothetical protein